MAMQISRTELPSSIVSFASGPSDPKDPSATYGTNAEARSAATKTAAPLYSHFSCWRRSAADRR
jgi:hypothetical protein